LAADPLWLKNLAQTGDNVAHCARYVHIEEADKNSAVASRLNDLRQEFFGDEILQLWVSQGRNYQKRGRRYRHRASSVGLQKLKPLNGEGVDAAGNASRYQ
jgi:hypothetical protein